MNRSPVQIEIADAPELIAVHRHAPDRWPFLLASSASAGKLGRWSILMRADGDELRLSRPGGPIEGPGEGRRFLERLRQWGQREARPADGSGLPFRGGWFVYLGYELAGEIEPTLQLPPAGDDLPVALARRCTAALIHDHAEGRFWLVAEEASILDAARAELTEVEPHDRVPALPTDFAIEPDPGSDFMAGVERIRRYIRDGDVFQVNLSRGWQATCSEPLDPAALYQALARSNPAPFAALARMPGGTVVSSSPERLVEVRGGQVQTRPIAGTRPRGQSGDDDRSLSAELIAHPKERAEHIMLIDLERNDLGRVCVTGSVEVDELMVIESYAHVHHIVSNVRGILSEGMHATDAIAAVFPGGTITGCPKVRCMEIIAELEGRGRSFYTGALGYLGLDGSLDLNILIRSMAASGNALRFRTGAGIVIDSDPAAELSETEDKARGLLGALRQ